MDECIADLKSVNAEEGFVQLNYYVQFLRVIMQFIPV